MTTYVTLRNRIANEVRSIATAAATDISADIAAAVQSAVKHYEREEFYFNTKTNTFSTVADQEYYSSSDLADIATLINIRSMTATISGVKLPVKPLDFGKIDHAQNGEVKAHPEYFAYYKRNLRFYPIPDAVYTITLAYHYRLTALSEDADSNAWTTDAEELIRARASYDLYRRVTQDHERAAFAKADEADALSALRRETAKRRSNNILRQDDAMVSRGGYNINYE
jgi:hypothetical protein